jgi:hypothetical protein
MGAPSVVGLSTLRASATRGQGTEAVWEIVEHRYVYIEEHADRTGAAELTLFVDALDATLAGISSRGIEPAATETYDNGVRKVTYRDADGNEIGYVGGPVS